jgi:hypothetical protein
MNRKEDGDPPTLDNWRNALKEISNIVDFELEAYNEGFIHSGGKVFIW